MSLAHMAAAWASGTPPVERLVLLSLADWADGDGRCWPSIPTIANKTGLDARTVRRCTSRLEAAGHLARKQTPGRGTVYTLNRRHTDPGQIDPGQPAPGETGGSVTPTRGTAPPNTSIHVITSQKASPSSRRARTAIEQLPELPPGCDPERWNEFVEMRLAKARGAKRTPWTPGAAKTAIRDLTALAAAGHDPNACLAGSTLNGWSGLFPPKGDGHGNGHGAGGRGARDQPGVGKTVAAARSLIEGLARGDRRGR